MLKRYLTVAAAATLAVGLSACGSTDPLQRQDAPAPNSEENPGNLTLELSGTLTGAGASSQESAMDAWRAGFQGIHPETDRKSTRLNSSHVAISYAVFCLKKKKHRQCYNVRN